MRNMAKTYIYFFIHDVDGHIGKFVAESKFRDHPQDFIVHIRSRNRAALEKLITKPAVEAALIERLSKKALTYGQEISDANHQQNGVEVRHKIDAKVVVEMYKNWVIPLTRQVEVKSSSG
jgi:chorismate mutase